MSVTINDTCVALVIVAGDGAGGRPAEKVLLKEFAIGVVANGALASVAIQSGFTFGWRCGFAKQLAARRGFDTGDEIYFRRRGR
jgi:hypothetical protein